MNFIFYKHVNGYHVIWGNVFSNIHCHNLWSRNKGCLETYVEKIACRESRVINLLYFSQLSLFGKTCPQLWVSAKCDLLSQPKGGQCCCVYWTLLPLPLMSQDGSHHGTYRFCRLLFIPPASQAWACQLVTLILFPFPVPRIICLQSQLCYSCFQLLPCPE